MSLALKTVPVSQPTPMMAQYWEIKKNHSNDLLFYRMGDFYELFFEDAITASAALDITLTRRGQHEGQEIPMCGVPVHAYENYLSRLIKKGYRVAICEQVESPQEAKSRGHKAVVRREVVRLITPGTLTEDHLLESRSSNYLSCIYKIQEDVGIAWLELSTGEFSLQHLKCKELGSTLVRLCPSELIVSEDFLADLDQQDLISVWREKLTCLPTGRFDGQNAIQRLKAHYKIASLEVFGNFTKIEMIAGGVLLDYVLLTQKGQVPYLNTPQKVSSGNFVDIDAATRVNLELTQTTSGQRKGSLLWAIDRTKTGAGARMLAARLASPLTDISVIQERLQLVDFFVQKESVREDLRYELGMTPDLERALSRLVLKRSGPRDLLLVKDVLIRARAIKLILKDGIEVKALYDSIDDFYHLLDRLERALKQDAPQLLREGGFIERGYAAELDELITLRDESRRIIIGLQHKYCEMTGISSLKIKHNNVLGYHIDVTPLQADKLYKGTYEIQFIHRQSLANSIRFATVELSELERKILDAADKVLAIELALFESLVACVLEQTQSLSKLAQTLAILDVSSGLAALAKEQSYCKPILSDGTEFQIIKGRHPVVARTQEGFIANDCVFLDQEKLWILTGPNMAGKSTYLRQNALIALLAQMGSYVPAERAHIGIVDKLFSRVGAADDLARGRSTFMVEMIETATILHQATKRSLVILDEIGRGTSTHDGFAIASACVEYLHDHLKCRTLFATHYHELTDLSKDLKHLVCYTMKIKEWNDEIIFLHEVIRGKADQSYGIHVAKLAGLPPSVIARAHIILKGLESVKPAMVKMEMAESLPLFNYAPPSPVQEMLTKINPDQLTPKQAHDLLYELKKA